jgi:hypothetical protein
VNSIVPELLRFVCAAPPPVLHTACQRSFRLSLSHAAYSHCNAGWTDNSEPVHSHCIYLLLPHAPTQHADGVVGTAAIVLGYRPAERAVLRLALFLPSAAPSLPSS